MGDQKGLLCLKENNCSMDFGCSLTVPLLSSWDFRLCLIYEQKVLFSDISLVTMCLKSRQMCLDFKHFCKMSEITFVWTSDTLFCLNSDFRQVPITDIYCIIVLRRGQGEKLVIGPPQKITYKHLEF